MGNDQFSAEISRALLDSQKLLMVGNQRQKGIYNYRQQAYMEIRHYQMQMLQLEMGERRKHWENQMSAILARGQLEWIAGERKLNARYDEWLEETQREYKKQKELWDDKYVDFLTDKKTWLDSVTLQSTDYGNMEVLKNFGTMTQGAIDAAGEDVTLGDFSEYSVDADAILREVVDFKLLDTLLENARDLNEGIGAFETVIFTHTGPDKFTTADTLQAIKDFQLVQNEEYEKHLMAMEFEKLLDRVRDAEKSFQSQIKGANDGLAESLHRTMRNDGYVLRGSNYERDLVVGATLVTYLYDVGRVRLYNDYIPEGIDFSGELESRESEIESMDSESLQGIIDKVITHIEEKTEEIFGDEDDISTILLDKMGLGRNQKLVENTGEMYATEDNGESTGNLIDPEDFPFVQQITWVEKVTRLVGKRWNSRKQTYETEYETEEVTKTGFRGVDVNPGLFGAHVGFAPQFVEEVDPEKSWNASGQIKFEGAGEMGDIMGMFIFNKIREGVGWKEVNMPHYKKRLWDDRDSFIKAPSMQDLTTMAVSLATLGSTGAVGGVWMAAGMNLTSEAIFTASDVAEGFNSYCFF